jgi:FkbH-like protein
VGDGDVLDTVRREVDGYRYADYLRALAAVRDTGAERRPLRVAILRSYTVEPIDPVLRLRLVLDGFEPDVWIGGYNQYPQEVLDPSSGLHAFRPDLVLLLARVEELLPAFVEDYANRSYAEWEPDVARAAEELGGLARRVSEQLSATVIVQGMSLAAAPFFGVFDTQRADGQQHLVRDLNRGLAHAAHTPGVFLWDFDAFVRCYGAEKLYDAKTWYVSRNPYGQAAYPALVADLMRYIRSALGLVKKCVVLDLDNTLWGGVVGEDGFGGIALGDSYPGNCYKDFQRRLLRLYHRGILLAIASKNNAEEALQVIDEHPDMVLRREHFAAMRIDWNDKATNLRDMASELNIGVDSFVFVDDNPAECELVRHQLPDIDVVQVPERPYLVPAVADRLPGVENIRLTDEDRGKGAMYQAQAARRAHEADFAAADLEEFVRSLGMEVAIEPATAFSIPRIAQLTQKTNQFNATTRRYSDAQIRSFATSDDSEVFSVAAEDRFGDHGIIGVLMLDHGGGDTRIDTFLLSCRVIGRGIEQRVLAFAEERARARGSNKLVGEFIPTAKNEPAARLYAAAGYEKVDETRYESPLAAPPPPNGSASRG